MGYSWFLKCGSDLVGTIILDTFENWHHYGRFTPGPDYARYQTPLETLWEASKEYEALLHSDALIPDEALEQAEIRKENAEQVMDPFTFHLEDTQTHQMTPILDFHRTDDFDGVYWRRW
ncbi:MAG: hypothetical protein JWN14_3536 [Chthonomonadales bacterium]|nr:hypothetical protein [Chthonomonadales bacterium]